MKQFDVINPATEEVLKSVPDLGAAECKAAIERAAGAQTEWAARPAKERSALLEAWYHAMMDASEELAGIITSECGKPLAEARGEVAYGASFIKWYGEEAKRIYGETIPAATSDKRIIVLREPIGVVGAITPWNFPLAMITRKLAPALAVGCAGVVKPAAETPLTALRVAELAWETGIPRDLLAVITTSDSASVGAELCTNPLVRKISFTGSTPIGKLLMQQSASTVKKMALELGGNAPFIVFDDANIDAAVAGAIASKYRNAGQTCVCANRLLVQSSIYDEFVEKLSEAVKALNIGNGQDENVQIGPLISPKGIEKVEEHIEDALARGAKLVTGGKRLEGKGYFFEPSVLRDVPKDARIAREETFGPLAPIFRFESDEEAIAMANDTEFGLAAYFYANDLARVWRVMEGLEYGIVGVNEGIISTEVAPFGGIKESGLGREGGHHGAEEFLETKYICVGGLGG